MGADEHLQTVLQREVAGHRFQQGRFIRMRSQRPFAPAIYDGTDTARGRSLTISTSTGKSSPRSCYDPVTRRRGEDMWEGTRVNIMGWKTAGGA